MPDPRSDRPEGEGPGALGRIRRWAALASLAWSVLVAAYAIGFFGASNARGTTFLDGAFFLVSWALPLILIWLAAFLGGELARLRALAAGFGPLAAALEATRAALERHPAAPQPPAPDRSAAEAATAAALERLTAGQADLAAGLAALRAAPVPTQPPTQLPTQLPAPSPPPASPPVPAEPAPDRGRASRPAAGVGGAPRAAQATTPGAAQAGPPPAPTPEPEPALAWEEVVRALNFPRDADDAEGFRALKTALKRRSLAQALQAAEDVLTMLSQEDVYMDDLAPAPADTAAWRRFIAGARGEDVAALGGVTDPAALERARALMKEDTVFRDAVLFFLRRFDAVLQEFAREAEDARIADLADTRSGRAFQLLARASGAFA